MLLEWCRLRLSKVASRLAQEIVRSSPVCRARRVGDNRRSPDGTHRFNYGINHVLHQSAGCATTSGAGENQDVDVFREPLNAAVKDCVTQ